MRTRFHKSIMTLCTTTVIWGVCLVPHHAGAQQRFVNQVREQLLATARVYSLAGYQLSHTPYTHGLSDTQVDTLTFTLTGRRAYAVVAACDVDCSTLNMALYDEHDRFIAADTRHDDTPIVSITPRWTGTFTLRVMMTRCNNEPCYYGVGIFRQ